MPEHFIGVTKRCLRCGDAEEFRQNYDTLKNTFEEAEKSLRLKHAAWFPVSVGQKKYALCPSCIDAFVEWTKGEQAAPEPEPPPPVEPDTTVVAIIAEQLGVERNRVVEDATLMDALDGSSLDMVELALALEDKFKICIPNDVLEGSDPLKVDVKDVIDYVTAHAAQAIADQRAAALRP